MRPYNNLDVLPLRLLEIKRAASGTRLHACWLPIEGLILIPAEPLPNFESIRCYCVSRRPLPDFLSRPRPP